MEHYVSLFSQNSNSLILLAISFVGGILASLAPCTLAMLPLVIGYVVGVSKESPVKTFFQMLFFIFGMSIVFSVIGIVCALSGKVFMSIGGAYFTLVIASFIMVMGLHLAGVLELEIPMFINKFPKNTSGNLIVYPILIGIVFALAGTPCSTPILAAIMGFASITNNVLLSVLMLFLFSLGQGVIIVVLGVSLSKTKRIGGVARFGDILMKASGWLLILCSIYIFYKIFAPFIVS